MRDTYQFLIREKQGYQPPYQQSYQHHLQTPSPKQRREDKKLKEQIKRYISSLEFQRKCEKAIKDASILPNEIKKAKQIDFRCLSRTMNV